MSKILIVGSLAESLVNFRGDLIREFRASGHDVVVAAPPGADWVDEFMARWGVERRVLPLHRTGTSIVEDLRLLLCIREICAVERPDALLAYTIKPVIFGCIAAWSRGVPRIAAMITGLGFVFTPARSVRERAVKIMARTLYAVATRCADALMFQNPDDEAEFRRQGLLHRRLSIVRLQGSGVNLDRYARQALPDGPVSFLVIARLLVDKGIREYLDAARRLRTSHPGVVCHLVGPLENNPASIRRDELDAAVSAGWVVYHGAVQDVRPLLAACHVYVLPSYREGMPRSVLEALAVGRPIITTDAPGCRETVEDGQNGRLVPVGDSQALAVAMASLAAEPRDVLERMAASSRAMAEHRFDVHKVNAVILGTVFPNAQATV